MTEEEIKKKLTPEEYRILREKETEAPFSGEYLKVDGEGMFACKVCGQNLFSTDAKYNSGSGWPSFWESVDKKAIKYQDDYSHGMYRTEILCANCDSHLGHIFDDSSTPSGQTFCVNSKCLLFNPETKPDKLSTR